MLHFWVNGDERGDRVQLFCVNLGQIPGKEPIAVTNKWQEFNIDLTAIGGCNPTGVQAIVISTGPTPGEFVSSSMR